MVALWLATLACVGTQQLGTLSPDANPIIFTLLGEVDHAWKVNVVSGKNYAVIVQKLNSSHPLNQIDILVQQADESNISYIGAPVQFSDTAVTTNFIAPSKGTVTIIVSSKIGEDQENMGTFTIQVLKANP